MIYPVFNHLDAVASTNDIVLGMARDGAPEGTVITAQQQLEGRGRRGSVWMDESGQCVLMSILLRPNLTVSDISKLSFVASLSTAECLRDKFGIDALLKWPNDVFVGGKKIAGILIENHTEEDGRFTIIGVGVNILQTSFPPEIEKTATSLLLESGVYTAPCEVAEALATEIIRNYELFISEGFEEIRGRWTKYMWGVGRQADVESEGMTISGIMEKIDSDGALVLAGANGTRHTIVAADSVHVLGINLSS